MNSTYFRPQPELFGLRVVKYIRCSHDGQVLHGDTLEAQDALLDEFIKVNRMVLVDTFVDEALTARKKFTRRKEFVRLLDGVRAHSFDMILFTKLDRWFRNIGDYHKIQEILEANGVQWKAITESYDTTTTNGRLHINIRLSVAQDECDRDSDRIKDVFSYKLKNKTYLSGSLPRGLKLDDEKHVIIDPEWHQFAIDMFDHFESTCSKRGTQLFLQEKYGIRVCYDTVVRYLRNPLFMGQYRDDPDFCEKTISRERFERIQNLAIRNVRIRHTQQFYIFSGLLISCLGAVMDVAMSISSAIDEIYKQNTSLTRKELFKAGMRVGRDMMGTDSNTLILAFAGSSVSTLLLNYAYDLPYQQIINSNNIGIAIMQGLAGSFGIVLSVPLTVLICTILFHKNETVVKL